MPGIRSVLREENILLDTPCGDWKSVIQRAAGPLLMSGSIDTSYIDAMIQSFETNGSYFVYCPGVALAHAGPGDGVHFFGLSLIRLKNRFPLATACTIRSAGASALPSRKRTKESSTSCG